VLANRIQLAHGFDLAAHLLAFRGLVTCSSITWTDDSTARALV
jgi:hypothetical protein